MFSGLRIIESDVLVIGPFEDWSGVRSPGRARRRRWKHRQNIQFYHKPDPNMIKLPDGTIVGHPATVRLLKANIAALSQEAPHDR